MTRIAALALAIILGGPMFGARAEPVVVELFTSEGCSSCPPADAVLRDLARTRPDVIALGFHVDYWNRLGWHDPYSLPAATARQRRYATALGLSAIYTPQMVVDGRRDVLGSDRPAVAAALDAARADGPRLALRLTRDADGLTVAVPAAAGAGRLVLVGYDAMATTSIRGGENGGRTLSEANLVRSLTDLGAWRGEAVSRHVQRPAGERFVLLLQAEDGGVLGAVSDEEL